MTSTDKKQAAKIKAAIDSALWAHLTADEIKAIVTSHLIEKGS